MLSRTRGKALAAALCAAFVVTGPVAAWAQQGPFNNGNSGNGTIGTQAGGIVPGQQGGQQPGARPVADGSNAGGATTFTPPPECRYRYWMSGPAMADYAAGFVVPMFPPPPAGWQEHAEDLNGAWYQPRCEFTAGVPDRLEERASAFRRDNPPVWGATEPPPPPIPVVDLIDIVRDSQQLPSLVVSTNPDGQSVVALRTWVWPTGGDFGPVTSRAESGPNWAQVTATPGQLSLSSSDAGAELGSCATAPAWSEGAPDDATECYVSFRRSSAGRPGGAHTISVQMTWEIRLTTSDGRNELLASPPVVTDVQVPVAEVQSVLR
jgi:hypothetical protein